MRIYLIRHGETQWNRERRWQGQRDVPLSTEGRRQARRLQAALCGLSPRLGFVSDLKRARETAALALAHWPGPWVVVPALREANFGHWEGQRSDEVAVCDPERYRAYRRNPWEASPPEGESLAAVAARVAGWWRTVAPTLDYAADASYVVVAHGGSLRALAGWLVAADGRPWAPALANASVSVLELDGPAVAARVVCWNQVPAPLSCEGAGDGTS